jgi:hypothetical protein
VGGVVVEIRVVSGTVVDFGEELHPATSIKMIINDIQISEGFIRD